MKKCVNGEYIEMTEAEAADWEQAQKEVEDSNESSGGGSTVNDIKIQGNSIVENGIAEIPISTGYGTYGLQKVYGAQYTSGIKTDEFGLRLSSTNAGRLAKRASGGSNTPIQESTIDIAVKAAMTDGIGAEWTDTEKQGALERMGITVDENGICRFGK